MKHFKSLIINSLLLTVFLAAVVDLLAQKPLTRMQTDSMDIKDTEFIFSILGDTKMNFDYKDSWGYNAAISRALFTDDIFNIYYGLRYSLSRVHRDSMYTTTSDRYYGMTYEFSSISIPILLRVNFGNKFRFYTETGFSFELYPGFHESGRIVNMQDQSIVQSAPDKGTRFNREVPDARFFDMGMNLGGGFIVIAKRVGYKLGWNYHLGAFNTLMNSEYFISDLTNDYWFVSFGVFFRKYKKVSTVNAKF